MLTHTHMHTHARAQSILYTMILGKPYELESKFRLKYNMILNLLRVGDLKARKLGNCLSLESATTEIGRLSLTLLPSPFLHPTMHRWRT